MSAEELTQTTVAVAEGEGPETETESQPVCLAPHELHDLESIFWALCHICMTRNGPGQWRKELSDGSLRASVAVCSVFEPLQIYAGSAKMNVIRYPRYCTSTICDNLAPYFQPLHDLIKKLQIFLKAQYFAEMRGKPLADLHTPFMEIFADAIKNLCDEPAFDQFDISSDHLSGDPWQAVSLDFGGKTFEIKRNVLIMMGQVKKRRTTEQKNWDSPIKQRTKIQKAREEEAAEAAESASPPRKKPRT